jgi:murein DD-endopeptidase MepM/ murein hydrolase activator NlpD
LPAKRKKLSGVAALMALCIGTKFVPGAHAAASPALPRAPLAGEMTLPGAQPSTFFDAIWPSLRDVGTAPLAMTTSPDGQAPAVVCSRLASMCLPLAHEPANSAHQWSGRVIPLENADDDARSMLTAPGSTTGFELPASVIQSAAGSIDTTLRESLTLAGLPASVAAQIQRIFAGRVDLDARAQTGDTYLIVLATTDALTPPRVASVELHLRGETYDALWFTAPGSDHGAYYTLGGALLAGKPFAMPLDFRRVSSPFGMRTHPVFGEPRFHEGVDLTAPVGTPIYAAAEGTLELAASGHGYGKRVVLRHGDGYSTRYAHLAAYAPGLKSGQRVEQGQVIGYVGRTGTTTGPHLHFEVRLNDRPLDPLTLTSLQFVAPLTGAARVAFESNVESARTRLAALPLSQPRSGVRMAVLIGPRRVI